jgi:uncharacterized protein involved in type VI secretion and phage assembly
VTVDLVVPAIRAVVRHELDGVRSLELGIVTTVYTNEGATGESNLAADVRLRGSALELQRVPVAVGRIGLSAVPRPGDLVVLGFVGGDVNGAIVLGSLYDEQSRPADAKADEVVYAVPDEAADGIRRFELQLPNGNTLTAEDTALTIVMGGTTVKVEADGAITLEAAGDLVLSSKGSVSIKADASISIEAQQGATVKAQTSLALEAAGQAKLKGAAVSIAGTTSFSAG